MPAHLPRILLIDDNPGDIELTKEAFAECGLRAEFHVAHDGHEAVRYLSREGEFADAPIPDFIILDLNLPQMNGREVLAFIKQDERLKSIPTVILSTSDREQDVAQCYALNANLYVVKPPRWDQFLERIRSLETLWFSSARLAPVTSTVAQRNQP